MLADAIEWGAANNVDVINISISGDVGTTAIAEAVAQANSHDVLIVASYGNNDGRAEQRFPASYSGVIGVSGVNIEWDFADDGPCVVFPPDSLASSRWGPGVDLAGPFYGWSTIRNDGYGNQDTPPGYCGTSFAAPHVAGVAALVRAEYPEFTNDEIADILFDSAFDRGPNGWDEEFGHGIVDADAALALAEQRANGGGGGGPGMCEQNPEACIPEKRADRLGDKLTAGKGK